ncbi:hypothetical protein ABFB09_06565 [Dehalogenimonas sp. THU2]|uniref:hypothetical protein n=1 Tax=Dehalogenimonas sp. THU2 TaxID=3151121 RepID=UPI003218D35B
MDIDPDNPVVKLCAECIQAEMEGRTGEAMKLCVRAWEIRKDSFEECIAAHYLARYQETASDAMLWNRRALEAAEAAGDARVFSFYPSLYLNLGKSCEDMGDIQEAGRYYHLASSTLDRVGSGDYRETLRSGVEAALGRIGGL